VTVLAVAALRFELRFCQIVGDSGKGILPQTRVNPLLADVLGQ
jgi:hypothetical protein